MKNKIIKVTFKKHIYTRLQRVGASAYIEIRYKKRVIGFVTWGGVYRPELIMMLQVNDSREQCGWKNVEVDKNIPSSRDENVIKNYIRENITRYFNEYDIHVEDAPKNNHREAVCTPL